MSEEFYMSVTFSMPDAEHMEALETLIEHFDLCEVDEARDLLGQYGLASTQQMIEALTIEDSDYVNENDLPTMFADTFNDSVDDMELSVDNSKLKAEIDVEGHDHEAVDFCTTLVLILVAMQATDIQAKAGSAMWNASWVSQPGGEVKLTFEAEE